MTLEAPLRFRIRPGVLRVRIARAHPGASPSAAIPESVLKGFVALVGIAAGRAPSPAMTGAREWLAEADRLDKSVYEAIARTRTPLLDRSMRALSSVRGLLQAFARRIRRAGDRREAPMDAGRRQGVLRPSP